MKVHRAPIPTPLYRRIVEVMPVACVDAVLVRDGKFLLTKRRNKPARGLWWLVGGRILKGERLEEAMKRKVKEETGCTRIRVGQLLTTTETMFKNSAQGPSSHTVNSVFLVTVRPGNLPIPDGQSSELRWFSTIDTHWPSYVKTTLRLAGFK